MTTVRQLLDAKGQELWSIHPEKRIYDAIKMMTENDIEALLVIEQSELLGVITERHYARRSALEGKTSSDKVSAIMELPVLSVSPSDTLDKCMQIMIEHQVRHLPVLCLGSPVGMLSISEVVKNIIRDQRSTIDQLEYYIHGRSAVGAQQAAVL